MNLINFWYSKQLKFFGWIFYPLELIYVLIIFLRKKLYEYKIFKTYKFKIPIIIIGNLTVGGTGKTPVVMHIANYLKKQGFNPAVIMRGYKSKNINYPCIVGKNSDADLYGDEPTLVANKVDCPVIIGKNRVIAVEFLLKKFDNINVVISDDGLQHYSLARDLEIIMIDHERMFGNGHCLPLGPLREKITRLNTVNLILFNTTNNQFFQNKDRNNRYILTLVPEKIYNLINPNILKNFEDFVCVHAVSGIGNNQKFFNLLANVGINTINHEFPDHYKYQEKDLNFNDDLPVIMTEKDAVKCKKFAKENFWCQSVQVKFNLEQQLNNYLINYLKNYFVG